ncbi:hypothetical protein J4212_01005 [Candidatus Woesearchaeota archaeon]|nr:hypothetical protein [Candidatus Woesearchaeota archaeon]
MQKCRYNKGQQNAAFGLLIKILLAVVIASLLYFSIRRLGNAFMPR